jgi:hypothetical protein
LVLWDERQRRLIAFGEINAMTSVMESGLKLLEITVSAPSSPQ